MAVVFKLDSIASIGSAVALVIFTMITAAHLRIRSETGANLPMLVLAIVAAGAVFVTFVFTTLIHEPASIVTLAGILVLSIGLDYGWKRSRADQASAVKVEQLDRGHEHGGGSQHYWAARHHGPELVCALSR
jgi:L-asparagine transporter-like permease